ASQAKPNLAAVGAGETGPGGGWKPTAEAKKQASTKRLIAAALWVLAIGVEAFAIFYLLRHQMMKGFMVWLIACIVVMGILAIGGNLLWKQANRLDPASQKDQIRFFVQNQLGLIITMIAFVPLIILIFTNKDMKGSQKAIAGVIGIVVLGIAGWTGVDAAPPSTEQMSADQALVEAYTGSDQVYWVSGGSVYHLCAEYPAGTTIPPLARGNAETNVIYQGTVAQAVADDKTRLSSGKIAYSECGLTEGQPQFGTIDSSTGDSSTGTSDPEQSLEPTDSPS
ncbi:MAG: hypothetical protein LBV30_10235, partial [Propionibacteriaceae bacterium]|nr:hypothetical protein [Propionibacteriaceae bacterium]